MYNTFSRVKIKGEIKTRIHEYWWKGVAAEYYRITISTELLSLSGFFTKLFIKSIFSPGIVNFPGLSV